jgi:hypothetical protein
VVDHPYPWLRYVDAGDVKATDLDIDGMKVRNDAMEKLGEVDGFIVDNGTKRPYYVVVDSGGWFKSKHFLVPIGHARLDGDRDAIVVDIPKSRIERFPGFDIDNFERMSHENIRAMNDEIYRACSSSPVGATTAGSYWDRPDYAAPEWWRVSVLDTGFDSTPSAMRATDIARAPEGAELQAEREVQRSSKAPRRTKRQQTLDSDAAIAADKGASPHFDGRAQPGDVLGVETGGEQTHVGETGEDEDKRRIDSERTYSKSRK